MNQSNASTATRMKLLCITKPRIIFCARAVWVAFCIFDIWRAVKHTLECSTIVSMYGVRSTYDRPQEHEDLQRLDANYDGSRK